MGAKITRDQWALIGLGIGLAFVLLPRGARETAQNVATKALNGNVKADIPKMLIGEIMARIPK